MHNFSIIALAFIPHTENDCGQKMKDVFDKLKEASDDAVHPIFDHVETNHLRGRQKGQGYIMPKFPIPVWNCHGRVSSRFAMDNEGWYSTIG